MVLTEMCLLAQRATSAVIPPRALLIIKYPNQKLLYCLFISRIHMHLECTCTYMLYVCTYMLYVCGF